MFLPFLAPNNEKFSSIASLNVILVESPLVAFFNRTITCTDVYSFPFSRCSLCDGWQVQDTARWVRDVVSSQTGGWRETREEAAFAEQVASIVLSLLRLRWYIRFRV